MTIDLSVLKDILITIATVITSSGVIAVFLRKYFDKMVSKITDPITKQIREMDRQQCMNYLTEYIADVRNGVPKSDYQTFRAYDVYEHYTKDLKGNSYIKEQWETFVKGEKDHDNKQI